jgi:hypothetical protein
MIEDFLAGKLGFGAPSIWHLRDALAAQNVRPCCTSNTRGRSLVLWRSVPKPHARMVLRCRPWDSEGPDYGDECGGRGTYSEIEGPEPIENDARVPEEPFC